MDGVRITVPSGSSHVVSRRVATHTCRRRRRRSIEPGPPCVDACTRSYIYRCTRVVCYVDACWLRYVRLDPRIHVRTHFAAARRAECQSAREPSCPIRNRTRERERERDEGRLIKLCSFYCEYFDSVEHRDSGTCYHLLPLSSSSMRVLR